MERDWEIRDKVSGRVTWMDGYMAQGIKWRFLHLYHHGRGTAQWSRQNDLASFLGDCPGIKIICTRTHPKVAKVAEIEAIYGLNFTKCLTNVYLASPVSECATFSNRSQHWAANMRPLLRKIRWWPWSAEAWRAVVHEEDRKQCMGNPGDPLSVPPGIAWSICCNCGPTCAANWEVYDSQVSDCVEVVFWKWISFLTVD